MGAKFQISSSYRSLTRFHQDLFKSFGLYFQNIFKISCALCIPQRVIKGEHNNNLYEIKRRKLCNAQAMSHNRNKLRIKSHSNFHVIMATSHTQWVHLRLNSVPCLLEGAIQEFRGFFGANLFPRLEKCTSKQNEVKFLTHFLRKKTSLKPRNSFIAPSNVNIYGRGYHEKHIIHWIKVKKLLTMYFIILLSYNQQK